MHSSPKHWLALAHQGIAAMFLFFPAIAQACAVCVGSSPADHAYFWAILFLMSMPFLLGGSIGGWLIYTYWRPHGGGFTTALVAGCAKLIQRRPPLPAAVGGGEETP